jgi:hypothetical protein
MNNHTFHRQAGSHKTEELWPQLLIGAIGIGIVLVGLPAQASESQTPWEYSSDTSDAHTRCVAVVAESERDQVAALHGKLQAQQETVNTLKDQLNRQASTNAALQRQLAQPPTAVQRIPSFYAYPSLGLSLYWGRPWIYGLPFSDRPYLYSPHSYGSHHRGHRW